MKIVNKILLLAAALALSGCLTTGCTSVKNPTTGATSKVPDVNAIASIAQSAAYLGTTVYLKGIPPSLPGHPEALPQFELARTALQTLIAAGTFQAADLTAALQNLPIQELKGDTGSMIVGETVILWDQYGQQLASLDKAQVTSTYLMPIAKSILAGLNMAMPPPAPSTSSPKGS